MMMNKLQEYIQWAREHMTLGKTPSPVEHKVQDTTEIVHIPLHAKPVRKPRKKKTVQ